MIGFERLGLVGFVVVFLLGAVVSVFEDPGAGDDGQSGRRPALDAAPERRRPPSVYGNEDLPPISPHDPAIRIAPAEKGDSTGTAFSIGNGRWMTARHVIDGCSAYGVVTGRRRVARGRSGDLSPAHDLAVFRTDSAAPALGFDLAALKRGETAFHFGYPQGRPGDVMSSLLGRMRVVVPGRRRSQPVVAWAEQARDPGFSGSLGGMSGGPVLNRQGDVIGVSVAEARRRGRVFTAAPAALQEMLDQARLAPPPAGSSPVAELRDRHFGRVGEALRAGLSVSQVICRVR